MKRGIEMIDYIFDYLSANDVYSNDYNEQKLMEEGIEMYLLENGISIYERGSYYKRYIDKVIKKIDKKDLKSYFINYPLISAAKQIAIEKENGFEITEYEKEKLCKIVVKLRLSGLGDKYIPMTQVKMILGPSV